ncbi:methionyl-tRNA synthetase [Exophiala aquamarina CBS 119918]|uniref:Probable methionine--tRNA ligase, mitochondrial n=1 Tax=Exophiala aquamarina CBS 119918 TaxID=1182545 RepID=A0A072NVL3_9EURO|nr:methionyl-tRNA synthetase [Exophiala aquamarina CBS 119918]KEF51904.1 methionyl-tRNA synthetase [Exophiala aquamarina CBS 119918]
MIALELRARSFFLQCRTSARSRPAQLTRATGTSRHRPFTSCPQQRQNDKPYYVTSPIFYVNAAPHAGHLYTLILTDILKRWNRLLGDKRATLLTGTDEHGMKIQKAAQKAQTDVKRFCDQHAQQFKNLCGAANIDYNRFIRTTDADHKTTVEHFWTELSHNGYIYEAKHEGWYSVSDETFYPETQVSRVLDPSSGITTTVSTETGKEVEWTSETNYHFRLSQFQGKLLDYYRSKPNTIVPQQRMNFIIGEIENGLKDLSISRPSSRLTWGIRVPGDDSQTIYVWLDALLNYITMAGYPFKENPSPDSLWPPNCQVIGKDIIRFHTIYWPAFLMALDLPITQRFLTHAHWTMNSEKMSKSSGNGVNPFFAIDRYGVDAIRFYMAHEGGIVDDASYENSYIARTYNTILKNQYGNLLQRVFKSKKVDTRQTIRWASQEEDLQQYIQSPDQLNLKVFGSGVVLADIKQQYELIQKLAEEVKASMDIPNPRSAVQAISETIRRTNKFFHEAQLWDLLHSESAEEKLVAHYSLYITTETLRIISILLQPFIPEKAKAALDMMNVDESWRTFADARVGADFLYGTDAYKTENRSPPLFPALLSLD